MSNVAVVKVNKDVFRAVKKAMDLISWEKHLRPGTVVLKINAVWDKLYPGCTTSPMVIEGVLKVLLASGKIKPNQITIADTDTAAIMRADISFRIEGIERLAKTYGVNLVNLTKTSFQEIPFNGLVLKKLKISDVLLKAENIITLPVLKTHSYSGMTGGLKNQWGCIHDLRHNYHLVLHQAIVDVNNFFRPKMRFGLMDGLFGMDGQGPKTGHPHKVGYLFASIDLVALDSAATAAMGIPLQSIKHILFAEKQHLGSTKFQIIGDKLPNLHFQPANTSNLVMGTEMRLRRLGPKVEWLMFNAHSPLLLILRWSAKIYYDLWYDFIGQKNSKKMMATSYGRLWSKRYLTSP